MRQKHTGDQAGPPPLYSYICPHKAGMESQGLNEGTADPSGHSVICQETLAFILNCRQM